MSVITRSVNAPPQLNLINHELVELQHLLPVELAEYNFGPLSVTQTIVKDWSALNRRPS